ncbi:MAG: hydroxylase [Nocardiopsaceae bacterium]|nr:hydroxylase [Nocardiopsaceae bacterium]
MTDQDGGTTHLTGVPHSADPLDAARATRELLAVLAYAELTASFRLAEDASAAPALRDKAALGAMAAAEFGHFQKLSGRLDELGADLDAETGPFAKALDEWHTQTAPKDWLESLVKAYVGDGIAADFYREVAGGLDEPTRDLVMEVLADTGHADFAVEHVRAAIEADPTVAGRLALWARRLMGEALAQAQRVAADHPALAALVIGGPAAGTGQEPAKGEGDLAEITRLFARLTDRHAARMKRLGLST